ncbi:MAG: DNA translocase FtsK 4TM domain-containing protein [Deltaproteobacteria bacterium]|jgi:S-DNA-T family DNA segregation ATPase FtsK/SpoIIIE|nr:DNA translocase FtsK 4TM domain-containing protein [Deltaproteobacteria bacterium]
MAPRKKIADGDLASKKEPAVKPKRPKATKDRPGQKKAESIDLRKVPVVPPELPSLGCILLSALLLLALVSHHSGDYPNTTINYDYQNHIGLAGAFVSQKIIELFGLAAFWPILVLLLIPYYTLTSKGRSIHRLQAFCGIVLFLFSLLALLSIFLPEGNILWETKSAGGGAAGALLHKGIVGILGKGGALVVLPPLLVIGIVLFTGLTLAELARFFSFFRLIPEDLELAAQEGPKDTPLKLVLISDRAKGREAKRSGTKDSIEESSLDDIDALEALADGEDLRLDEAGQDLEQGKLKITSKPKGKKLIRQINKGYKLPDPELLDSPEEEENPLCLSREELTENARLLETKLKEFGVDGRVLEVSGGPVITMYEYQPAPGVKISKVSGLSTDLAMAMKVGAIRVVAPIPGKAAIGLELPNPQRTMVTLKELILSQAYQKLVSPLTLVLGVDITGNPVVTDLGKMPHLLIAGATGSGKSVGLDCMIMSILFKAGPEKVRFLMIDPKCVELALYQDLPHLIYPVLTDPGEATLALKWAVHEMDKRYKLMAALGVRNIQGYNEKVKAELKSNPTGLVDDFGDPLSPLPYLVIIIDELSDLMLTSPKDVEVAIMRLCAKARASGIHLILATQRPSVDVLTGVIKANLPTRISFQVATKFDSRTILDQVGAEQLLGKGDMLFQPPGSSKLNRLHGAYVSDDEKKRVTDFIRSFGPPDYLEDLTPPETDEEAGSSAEKDEKFQEAVELVRHTGRATISHIQRHLRIGYNRAARIIEDMEREGIIGPQDGTRPRAIL